MVTLIQRRLKLHKQWQHFEYSFENMMWKKMIIHVWSLNWNCLAWKMHHNWRCWTMTSCTFFCFFSLFPCNNSRLCATFVSVNVVFNESWFHSKRSTKEGFYLSKNFGTLACIKKVMRARMFHLCGLSTALYSHLSIPSWEHYLDSIRIV